MIVWAAAVLFENLVPSRRRLRQRCGMLSIDRLTRVVRNLMIARAGELLGARRAQRRSRTFAPPGFCRRMRARNILRAVAGARLRRFMSAGDDVARFTRLLRILGDLDAYARAFLFRRAKSGVNRLLPVFAVRPPRAPLRSQARPAPAAVNSS